MFSKVLRRTHMYLALFLTPWMLMYALSTMAMNHREFLKKFEGEGPPVFQLERELTYNGVFPPDAKPEMIAEQILYTLHMDGAHGVRRTSGGSRVTIMRQDPISPRRITFTPADGKLVIEKQVFQTPAFLERMHRRRGYQARYPLEDAWAFSVDLTVFAMVFWVASGLWMWWEMRVTRLWGAAFALAGIGLIGLFLATI